MLTCLEICAGGGGQAIGLEQAGFRHVGLIEIEKAYCESLSCNRPAWNVIHEDLKKFTGKAFRNKVDLLAGGVPCPPFSIASRQLGSDDERDLFPDALRLVEEVRPRVVLFENVPGFLSKKFSSYRSWITASLRSLGYDPKISLLNASDFGVPQLRPRMVLVAFHTTERIDFIYPRQTKSPETVGSALGDLMGANGWLKVDEWRKKANKIAPTIVGGSKKHGGPDLGPTRARKAWAELGVDGHGVADKAPPPDYEGLPRLTKEMIAKLQGFPDGWNFGKRKTVACRMIGNAFPPPVACAVGKQIERFLNG